MTFSKEWNQRYQENTQMSIWPWSDLISYVKRFVSPINKELKVLELGCGAGANIPFFKQLGVDYHAVEGSEAIVKNFWSRFPELKSKIKIGDFTNAIPWEYPFDLVIDRSALTLNSTSAICNCINSIYKSLSVDAYGYYIGIDWFSVNHSAYREGGQEVDKYTRTNYIKGQFANVGRVHFSDADHIKELFADFELLALEEKIITQYMPNNHYISATWNFVAKKKKV